ncbi:MAG TPA: hypothetical protein VK477_11120 [Acidobacteriota bacterium]|nr:hypothetical protein [Acidobacteriota bacterium]
MSTLDPKELTLRVERALLAMEKRFGDGLPLRRFATIYDVPEADLASWLAAFNGGSNNLKPGTLAKVKRKLGIVSEAPSASRESAAAPEVTQSPAQPSTSGQSTAGAVRKVAEDDGASPWEKYPRGPRAATLAAFRVDLDNLAEGTWGKDAIEGKLRSFCSLWLGSVRPAPGKVKRFLAWVATRGAAATITASSVRPPAEKRSGRVEDLLRWPGVRLPANTAPRDGRKQPAPRATAGDWVELEIRPGNFSDVAARYTGAGIKHPSLTISSRTAKALDLPPDARVTLRWNGVKQRLAIVPATGGLVLRRQRSGGLRMVCGTLADLLGAAVRTFNRAEDRELADSFAEFVEVLS